MECQNRVIEAIAYLREVRSKEYFIEGETEVEWIATFLEKFVLEGLFVLQAEQETDKVVK